MSDLPLPTDAADALGIGATAPASRTLDQILGAEPKPRTLDDILNAPPSFPLSDWLTPHYEAAGGRTPGQIVKGIATAPLGDVAKETIQDLKDWGVFNDYEKGQNSIIRRFNEALLQPAIAGADLLGRIVPSAVHEYAASDPLLTPLAAAMEAFPGGHFTGFPARIMPRALPSEAAHAEPSWEGTAEPAAETDADHAVVAADVHATRAEAAAQPAIPAEPAAATVEPENVNDIARRIAPDIFAEYDPLVTRRDTYRRWLDDLATTRQQNAEAAAPHGDQIADIERRLETANPRMTKIYQDRLEPLVKERDDFIADAVGRDTADMTRVRQELQKNDYRMRDLAPSVSEAYRRAQGMVPEGAAVEPAAAAPAIAAEAPATPEAIPQPAAAPPLATLALTPLEAASEAAPALTPEQEQVKAYLIAQGHSEKTSTEAAIRASPAAPEAPAPAAPPAAERAAAGAERIEPPPLRPAAAPRAPVADIAADVSRKLVDAGRPPEEADAAAALVAAHYEARSANLAGTTPGQLYADEAPAIVAGRGVPARAEELELAQKGAPPEFTLTPPATPAARETLLPGLERTAQGVQRVLPGTERSAAQAAAAREAEAGGKIAPKAPQKEPGGLFKPAEEPETELFQPAYHGSPFQFDKFTLDHIGEGEGAQAYGHGLYFASRKAVAAYYREALSGGLGAADEIHSVLGVWAGHALPTERIGQILRSNPVLSRFADDPVVLESMRALMPDYAGPNAAVSAAELRHWRALDEALTRPGRLYHVELAPAEDEYLDWDKPLQQQSEHVQAALKAAGVAPHIENSAQYLGHFIRQAERNRFAAADLFNKGAGELDLKSADVSNRLHAAGIRGIRYRDEGSRTLRILSPNESTSGKWVVGNAPNGPNRYFTNEAEARADFAEHLSHNYVIFDPDDITIKSYEQAKRGAITLRDGQATIRLFAHADASTFIHETGHQWLEELTRDARDERATQQVRDDAATVRKWLGAEEDARITTRQHEKFARGFERYMMEGRAPSAALAQVFAKFKEWLTRIYQTVNRLRSPITDDIRSVFDRMLATPEERTVIAPEAEAPKGLADTHEALAETTPLEHAAPVAEQVRGEMLASAHPEVHDEIRTPVPGRDAGGVPLADQATDRDAVAPRPAADEAAAPPRTGAVVPGGDEIAEEGDRAPAPAVKPAPLYEKVPRAPMRLVDFLKKNGGLADDTFSRRVNTAAGRNAARRNPSDIRTVAEGSRGLIKARTGMSLDRATELAWEAGYLPGDPDDIGSGQPHTNALLDAIDKDLRGDPVYSEHDAEALRAFQEASDRNAQIDLLAARLGIDTTGMSNAQFWDAAAEKMSVEEAAAEHASLTDAHEVELAEARRRAKEWIEAQSDAWEPDKLEADEPRSLEDLEREQQQRDAAARAAGSPGGAGEPGPAGGYSGALQEGGGQRGGGPGVGGRDQPEGGAPSGAAGASRAAPAAGDVNPALGTGGDAEPATAATDAGAGSRATASAEGITAADRTAWIDRLNTTEDARDIIREMSLQTQDFRDARFGKPAYQLYHDAKAARQLVEETSQATADAAAKWATSGAEEDAAGYAHASQQLLMAAEVYNEIKAGWGRAGHAFQRIDRMAQGESVAAYVQRTTGRTLFQIQQERDLAQALPDAAEKAKFIGETRMTRWQKLRAGYLSYFINNLISGPITHGAYAVGNTNMAIFKVALDSTSSAAIDSVRQMIAGEPLAERVYWSEVPAQIYGATRGARDGLAAAGAALKTGVPYMKGADLLAKATESGQLDFPTMGDEAFRPQAIPGRVGYVLETPSRAVSAIHTLFYSMGYEQEIARLAVRAAMREGLEGDAYNARVAEFTQDPPIEAIEAAHDEALAMVLMKRPAFQTSISALQRAVNGNVVAKTIMPFMQIGTNILDQAFIQHTPLAFLSETARDNLLGRNGEAARSLQYGKIASGVMVSGAVIGLAAEDILTGGGPSDPHERMRKELTGWKPYSIRLGDHYFPYRKFLGPIGALVGGVANMYEVGHVAGTGEYAQAASAAIFGLSEVVADETWARGLSDFINAARNWDRDGGRYLRNLGANFVPFAVGMGQLATVIDPYQREVHSFVDAVKNKIPALRQSLDPRVDFWGEPIAGHTMVGPSAAVDDPVNAALIRLDIPIAPITRKVDGVGLNDQQYADLAQVAGRLTKTRLDEMVNQPSFAGLAEASQRDMITKTISSSRKAARSLILAQNRDIIDASQAAKRAYRDGASKKQVREMLNAPAR